DCGSEKLNRLQLKRADFEREEVEVFGLIGDGAQRQADIARGNRSALGVLEHPFHQFRCGCLAVGAGNGNVQAKRLLVAEFKFAVARPLEPRPMTNTRLSASSCMFTGASTCSRPPPRTESTICRSE